jgi:hypothetical protein
VDSFYEYLWGGFALFGDQDFRNSSTSRLRPSQYVNGCLSTEGKILRGAR